MNILIDFSLRLIPGLVILVSSYLLLPAKEKLLRLFIIILGFILMRDAMTPVGIWEFGNEQGVMWLRFIDSPLILLLIGVFSVVLTWLIHKTTFSNYKIDWFGNHSIQTSITTGLLGSLLAAGPFILPYFFVPIQNRGGSVPVNILPALLIFALLGNFLEEVIFRGFLQDYFEKQFSPIRVTFLSALFFAAGHVFLAITVTDLGALILIFTFWEGLICAWLAPRYGMLSATLAHGLTIFLLASGIF